MYKDVVKQLLDIPEIVECHYTTGPYTMLLKVESYVCACAIANALRIHFKAAAYDYATLYEVLYTLMDCST
jgi:hypothetical protein